MDVRRFHHRLFGAAEPLLPVGSTVVCAVSGGADSMALLHGLSAVNEIHRRRWRLLVAHLDHQLRGEESRASADFARKEAERLGFPCTLGTSDVAGAARRERCSIEQAARTLRYDFLGDVATRQGAAFVATAHQADDQAETLVHRIARGTGLAGLAGILPSRRLRRGSAVRLVRPLLDFRRSELREYLVARSLAWRDDPTNDDAAFATRNRIRHLVLPMIADSLNPRIVRSLMRLARHARHAREAIAQDAKRAWPSLLLSHDEHGAVLDAVRLAALPQVVQAEAVRRGLLLLHPGSKGLSAERLEAVLGAARGDGRKRTIELAGGLIAERRGRRLLLKSRIASSIGGSAQRAADGRFSAIPRRAGSFPATGV